MDEIRISADRELLDAFRTPSRRGWDTEATLRVIQMIGLLVAGLWVAFLYVTFQRQSNELALDAAQLHQEQAELDLKKTELDVAKSTIEVSRLGETPLTTKETLRVAPLVDDQGAYFVTYDYSFINPTENDVMITDVMAEAFVARTGAKVADAGVIVNDVGDSGSITWVCISRRGFRTTERWNAKGPNPPIVKGKDSAPAEYGGGGTGRMKARETIDGNVTLLVRGKPTDLVGFRVRYTINDGKDPNDNRRLRNFVPLGIATSGGTS